MTKYGRFWQNGRIVLPLRLYHALSSIITLCVACLLSSGFVYWLTTRVGVVLQIWQALGICCLLTVLLGGLALAWEAKYYIRPAEVVVQASSKVAKGIFTMEVPLPNFHIIPLEGIILIENFNLMTRELHGMDQMRKEFIENVSHEFKTPIASIAGLTELLLEGGFEEKEKQEFLSLVHAEALRLSRLSENVLRLSRLDSQEIVSQQEKVAVDEQIRQTLILLTEKYSDTELLLDIHLETITVISDPDLLMQIWLNLIDNALKYSPSGTTLHIAGKVDDDIAIISIRDEGIGIPSAKQARIWSRFYQCEESHKEQGHGLGLSIVKRIVELLGGSIDCRSEVGQGTEMILRLPRNISQKNIQRSHLGHNDVLR
ncbi:MAG: HAMP domain-containing sensor histidine kinase [Planctomycetia bacterium]|nr:HAMP domain-containing sensor histidine kinase [Planctomycetia bacterium]